MLRCHQQHENHRRNSRSLTFSCRHAANTISQPSIYPGEWNIVFVRTYHTHMKYNNRNHNNNNKVQWIKWQLWLQFEINFPSSIIYGAHINFLPVWPHTLARHAQTQWNSRRIHTLIPQETSTQDSLFGKHNNLWCSHFHTHTREHFFLSKLNASERNNKTN